MSPQGTAFVSTATAKTAGTGTIRDLYQTLAPFVSESIYGNQRERSLRSHLRFVAKHFKTFSQSEFDRFVLHRYLEALEQGKPFNTSYMKNVLDTICRRFSVQYDPARIGLVLANVQKLTNGANYGKQYFCGLDQSTRCSIVLGERMQVTKPSSTPSSTVPPTASYQQLRALVDATHQVARKQKNRRLYYTPDEMYVIKRYCREHLENFTRHALCRGHPRPASTEQQLAMIVLFLLASPRRISELLAFTERDWAQLIHRQYIEINSKKNHATIKIFISDNLASWMLRYANAVGMQLVPDPSPTQRVFPMCTETYRRAIRAMDRTLFGAQNPQPVMRPFHAFRNYYAAVNVSKNSLYASRALGHTPYMTRRYARAYMRAMKLIHQNRTGTAEKKQEQNERETLAFINQTCTLNDGGDV